VKEQASGVKRSPTLSPHLIFVHRRCAGITLFDRNSSASDTGRLASGAAGQLLPGPIWLMVDTRKLQTTGQRHDRSTARQVWTGSLRCAPQHKPANDASNARTYRCCCSRGMLATSLLLNPTHGMRRDALRIRHDMLQSTARACACRCSKH